MYKQRQVPGGTRSAGTMNHSANRRYLDGGFQQTYRAAASALGLRLGLEVQQRAVFQDEVPLLPAVQEVRPLVQVTLHLDTGSVPGILVVLGDLRCRVLGHRHRRRSVRGATCYAPVVFPTARDGATDGGRRGRRSNKIIARPRLRRYGFVFIIYKLPVTYEIVVDGTRQRFNV